MPVGNGPLNGCVGKGMGGLNPVLDAAVEGLLEDPVQHGDRSSVL